MKMMMKHRRLAWLCPLVMVAAVGCTPPEPRRFAMVTELRPDRAEYYRELHANPWPEVIRRLKESNIHNYSIYECEIEGRLWLFSYFEYTGRDFDADMKAVADDPVTQKWCRETDPCQIPLPAAAQSGEIWTPLQEVFRME